MRLLRQIPSCIAASIVFSSLGFAQVTLVDWDFSSLVNPGIADGPIAVPLLSSSESGAASGFSCTDLIGKSANPSNQGLLWSTSNSAPGELNLRYFDGDLSDPGGTNNDGVNDNYLSFKLATAGAPMELTRISVSAWRNGAGAPGNYAIEVVVDDGAPTPFGAAQTDANFGDSAYDTYQFQDTVTAYLDVEIRFRPTALPGGQGTGNLHINGFKVEAEAAVEPKQSPNVLFFIADDLAAGALRSYGNLDVQTPNIDALADRGVQFENAYCQYPVCHAARASLFTGWYTERIQAAGGGFEQFDAALGTHSTLPEHFRLKGYQSARVSKIYHMRIPGDITAGVSGPDHAGSWNTAINVQAPEWFTPGLAAHYTNENLIFDQNQHYNLGFGAAFYTVEASTIGVEQADAKSAAEAVQLLDSLQNEQFFLAVGFVRPHVPLVAPASTYALYHANQLPLADSVPGDLQDIPAQGVFWNEPVRGPFSDSARREVLRAYYASITFMDEQLGIVMDKLIDLGLDEETIIVFTSDHGYHLGEHTMWQKLSLHEESARVPLIIAAPGVAPGTSSALVENLDLYPTLADLAGLDIPAPCQGISLRPLLEGTATSVRDAAFCSVSNGDLLRTDGWAYMRYSGGGEELYDMVADPLQFTNLVSNPAHQATLIEMRARLDAKLLAVVSDPGSAYCFGDGTGAICPCLAFGVPGEGCLNSSGTGATLTGGGLADTSSDGFHLTVAGGPPNQPGLLFQGVTAIANPLANGILCTTSTLRHGVQFLDAEGGTTYSNLGPTAQTGGAQYYQYYFRDVTAPCGGGFNFTNGWQVLWN